MADVDKSSKTEPPTEKKLSESRSKGQFAKAPEIGMTFTLLAGLLIILFLAEKFQIRHTIKINQLKLQAKMVLLKI